MAARFDVDAVKALGRVVGPLGWVVRSPQAWVGQVLGVRKRVLIMRVLATNEPIPVQDDARKRVSATTGDVVMLGDLAVEGWNVAADTKILVEVKAKSGKYIPVVAWELPPDWEPTPD